MKFAIKARPFFHEKLDIAQNRRYHIERGGLNYSLFPINYSLFIIPCQKESVAKSTLGL